MNIMPKYVLPTRATFGLDAVSAHGGGGTARARCLRPAERCSGQAEDNDKTTLRDASACLRVALVTFDSSTMAYYNPQIDRREAAVNLRSAAVLFIDIQNYNCHRGGAIFRYFSPAQLEVRLNPVSPYSLGLLTPSCPAPGP